MKKWAFFFTVFSVIVILAACSSRTEESAKSIDSKTENTTANKGNKPDKASLQLLNNANIGEYLADSNGMTLYYYTKDQVGKSNCSGECLINWPAFSAKDFDVP